jgi:ferric-dicitrate binding protein FerR (iron transport regulator)
MKEDEVFRNDFDNAERIGYLIASFIKGTLTPLERRELDQWILASEENELLFDELTSEENIEATMKWYASVNEHKAAQRLRKRIAFAQPRKGTISLSFIMVAASFVLLLGFAVIYLITRSNNTPPESSSVAITSSDPLPGYDKAVLTLADGKKIVLDSTAPSSIKNGTIKIGNGTIVYGTETSDQPSENILTIPRGGQYKAVLPDGTKVWLNAESSLRYSTAFTDSERKVMLTGEAYFEVTKNKEKPFIVESSAGTVKVLGTQFNVNSYGDENVFTTTLVEGSVQITKGAAQKILKPGEQAKLKDGEISVAQVDTREFTSWKEGEFVFRNAPVLVVVKQLQRWYDLNVEFREPVEKHLNATIKRNVPLSKVLHYLEQTGDVHFQVDGKKLIVMK